MIIIAPFAQKLPHGGTNPKNYPFWRELIKMIDRPIVQVGVEGEEQLVDDFRKDLSVVGLRSLIKECDTWISCDSFFQHLGWDEEKKGIVLWSVSDPLIYGHPENINLLKDRKHLEENQFGRWDAASFDEEKFVGPELVYGVLTDLLAVDKSSGIKSNTGQS